MEVRKLKEALAEKEHRLQYSEEVNNRLVFRMRSHQTEMSAKENEIKELKQEINFLKSKTSKPVEICIGSSFVSFLVVSEIKQKDMVIQSYKKRMREDRSSSIPIRDIEPERLSFSYGQIPSNLSSVPFPIDMIMIELLNLFEFLSRWSATVFSTKQNFCTR